MDNRSISIVIEPTEESTDVDALYTHAWSLLAGTIRRNAKHGSAKAILDGYLDETEDDGRGFSDENHLEFSFQSPASACDVQMEVTAHWFELAIALAAKDLVALCREHGYAMKPPRATADALAGAVRKVAFVPNGDAIVGVTRAAKPKVLVDGRGPRAIDDADLTAAARKLARVAVTSGTCACAFCVNVRAGKAVVAKPKAATTGKKAAPAATPSKPVKLEHFTNAQKALRAPDRCGSLDLKGRIDVLPNAIGNLRRMTALDVAENSLSKLPASLFTLTALESLDLSGNAFTKLPAETGNLESLKELHLARTALTTLPDAISRLRSLEVLSLTESCVTEIPRAILRLARLRRLSLTHLHALAFPLPNLGELTELQSLELARVRRPAGVLDAIDFSSMKKLVELDLSWVDLPSLPASVRELPHLQTLAIERTDFTDLPQTFVTLTALTELRASATKFASWPTVLNQLPHLKRIDLRLGKIANIDALRSLPALEMLSLERTPLTHLPSCAPHLPALTTLILDDTKLTELPPWLATLPALKLLHVARTPLPGSELDALKRRRPDLEIRLF